MFMKIKWVSVDSKLQKGRRGRAEGSARQSFVAAMSSSPIAGGDTGATPASLERVTAYLKERAPRLKSRLGRPWKRAPVGGVLTMGLCL